MKLNRHSVELAMARACMNLSDIVKSARLPEATAKNALYGRSVKPATAGKIARALNVDITDLLEKEA